jgi:glycopeptide antibiotics resistance protein
LPIRTPSPLQTSIRILVLALVVYGSLFPFAYQPHSPQWSDVLQLLRPTFAHMPKGDLIGNIVLFVPYGMLLGFSAQTRFPWRGLLLGAGLAVGVQYLQYWFPDRDPSGMDAVLNGVGMVIGWLGTRLVRPWLDRMLTRDFERPRFVVIASGLMLLWLLYRWFPLVPTLDFQNVKNGLKPLLHWGGIDGVDVLRNLAGWLVFLRLGRYSALQQLRYPTLALLCALVMAEEPLFVQNAVSPANVIGLVLALNLGAILHKGQASLVAVVLLLGVSIGLAGLVPLAIGDGQPFHWIPFAGSLGSDPIHNIPPLIEKCFLYGSLVFLTRYLGVSLRTTCWLVGGYLLALEWAQQWLPGRTPEITDPLLALGLVMLMQPVFSAAPSAGRARPMAVD